MKFGNSALLQAPNIKTDAGAYAITKPVWMTHFKYGTRTLAELEAQEMIRPNNPATGGRLWVPAASGTSALPDQASLDDLHKLQPKVWQLGY